MKRLIAEITHTLYALIDDVYEEETEENETNAQIMAQVTAFVSEEINKMVIGTTPIDDINSIRERL